PRHRPDRRRPRPRLRRAPAKNRRRRLHDHSAGREVAASPKKPLAKDPGSHPRPATGSELQQKRDPRPLSQPSALRRANHRHRPLPPPFVERVRAAATGTRIVTTLDARLQRDVLGIIAAAKPELLRHGAHSVAVAVLDNRSGEWLAWEGSGDYFGDPSLRSGQ